MSKPSYDDLVFLVAFLWKWSDEAPVFQALVTDDEEAIDNLFEQTRYQKYLKKEDFWRARDTFWALKDELIKINGFWE